MKKKYIYICNNINKSGKSLKQIYIEKILGKKKQSEKRTHKEKKYM